MSMTRAVTAKALATAAVAATAGLAATPASAASHPPASTTAAKPQGFVPRASSASTEPGTAPGQLILRSVGGCETSALGGLTGCGHITGHGNHVSNVSMYHVCVLGAGMWISDRIVSPQGSSSTGGEYYRSHGNCIPNFRLNINANAPGYWVFRVREYLPGGGGYSPISIALYVV